MKYLNDGEELGYGYNGSTVTIKNMIDNLSATPKNTEILRQGGMWELGNHEFERTIASAAL